MTVVELEFETTWGKILLYCTSMHNFLINYSVSKKNKKDPNFSIMIRQFEL